MYIIFVWQFIYKLKKYAGVYVCWMTWLQNIAFETLQWARLKLESGNRKIQYGRQAAILKVTSLQIYGPLRIATNNMHMKFEIEISKQTWIILQKPRRLQTDRWTRWIQDTLTLAIRTSSHDIASIVKSYIGFNNIITMSYVGLINSYVWLKTYP